MGSTSIIRGFRIVRNNLVDDAASGEGWPTRSASRGRHSRSEWPTLQNFGRHPLGWKPWRAVPSLRTPYWVLSTAQVCLSSGPPTLKYPLYIAHPADPGTFNG